MWDFKGPFVWPFEFSRSNFCRKIRSEVEIGAERNVHERDTLSCGELLKRSVRNRVNLAQAAVGVNIYGFLRYARDSWITFVL